MSSVLHWRSSLLIGVLVRCTCRDFLIRVYRLYNDSEFHTRRNAKIYLMPPHAVQGRAASNKAYVSIASEKESCSFVTRFSVLSSCDIVFRIAKIMNRISREFNNKADFVGLHNPCFSVCLKREVRMLGNKDDVLLPLVLFRNREHIQYTGLFINVFDGFS